jgi:copper chaperone
MTDAATGETVRFRVDDMSCGHCEKAIRKALSETLPGAAVDVDLAGHMVTVAGPVTPAEAAIREAGYTPVRL